MLWNRKFITSYVLLMSIICIETLDSWNFDFGNEEYYNGRQCKTIHGEFCTYAECTDSTLTAGQTLDLHNINNIPITYIIFKESVIHLVPVGVFTNFQTLERMYLNGTYVENIHPGAFTGLSGLKELYLKDNNLTSIMRGMLNSLPSLTILDLSNNYIKVVEKHAFVGLFNLINLILNHNKIKNLSSTAFDGLSSLQILDLSYNYLLDIPSGAFFNLSLSTLSTGFASELKLDLSFNNLTSVKFHEFPSNLLNLNLSNNHINIISHANFLNIEQLDLSNNQLSHIDNVYTTLQYLNYRGNNIQELNDSLFFDCQSLVVLDLSYNMVRKLPEDVFTNLSNLNDLYLQNNLIEDLPIGCFRNLHSLFMLNISSNRIAEFDFGTFAGLDTLTALDISNNSLTYLFESSFHTLTNLRYLNIDDNALTSFDPHDLLIYTNTLKTVSLKNNPWNCQALLKIITIFELHKVEIIRGPPKKVGNVYGISCLKYKFNRGVTKPDETFSNRPEGPLLKSSIDSNESATLTRFFNKDFFNSNFYQHFTNFTSESNSALQYTLINRFDHEFKNTTFYKLFQQDSFNSTMFKHFSDVLANLSKELRMLDSSLHKLSQFQDVNINLSKYYNDDFKNSTVFKYFNVEFFKFLNESFQAMFDLNSFKRSNELDSLHNYFNWDFKNSTFYKFFQKFNCTSDSTAGYASVLSNRNLESGILHAKLTGSEDSNNDQEVLNKLSGLQSSLSTLSAVVIIILICMIIMPFFKNGPINRIFYKTTGTTPNASQSTAGLELI